MPRPFDEKTDAGMRGLLNRLRENHEAQHGPGSFDQTVAKGKLLMTKKAHELTADEAAFLQAPPPAKKH